MAFSIGSLIDRYAGRRAALPSLDVLASTAAPKQPLEERLNWLVDVVQWVRRPGHDDEAQAANVSVQGGRVRRFLDVLDKNPEWKAGVAQTLRSIVKETRAVALFSETGLPGGSGLFSEIGERLSRKFLPPPPGSAELGILFDRLFPYANDEAWIRTLDEATLGRLMVLLEYGAGPEEKDWNTLGEELEDALEYLAAQIRVKGCSGILRQQIKHQNIRELAFFKLGDAISATLSARHKNDEAAVAVELNHVRLIIDAAYRARAEVLEHLETGGVSTDVVYSLAFIEASLQRIEDILELIFDPSAQLTRLAEFVSLLVRQNRARESVVDLLRRTFHLLTRKMVERTGDTGEHYIARTRVEYSAMLKSAAGGGVIMAFTAWFKTILLAWGLPGLMEGITASVNYSIGFVAIQLTGSTLATKQPANTAPALAARMHNVRDREAIESLVDEIVFLVRSQIASIVGNLALIVPTMLALCLLIPHWTGQPLVPAAKAPSMMHSLSILGPSPFYGAFTGVLLWASALVGGWAGNWAAWHRIGEALAKDRRLIRLFGTTRAGHFAGFWTRNLAGLASNISFGFMLGIIPELAKFADIPLDIRHVTLSAGFLTASVASLGPGVMATRAFVLAVLGVVSIGLMNLMVSFYLAMLIATRACGIQSPERRAIYGAVAWRALTHPISFLLPTFNRRAASVAST